MQTKTCSACGEQKPLSAFHKKAASPDGHRSQCKECRKRISAEDYRQRRDFIRESQKRYAQTDAGRASMRRRSRKYYEGHAEERADYARRARLSAPWKPLLYGAKHRAKRLGLPFNLDADDVRIPEVCPVLGTPLRITEGKVGPNSPTVDRIIPERGYVKGNVIVVSHRANAIKNNATAEELRRVAGFYSALAVACTFHDQQQAEAA